MLSLYHQNNRFYRIEENNNRLDILFKTSSNKSIQFKKWRRLVPLKKYTKINWIDKLHIITNNKDKFGVVFKDINHPKIVKKESMDINKKYIIKPINGSGGEGIKILNSYEINEMKKLEKYIIQEIIESKRINNNRFDIRLYYFVIKLDEKIETYFSLDGKIRVGSNNNIITNSNMVDGIQEQYRLSEKLSVDENIELIKLVNRVDEKMKEYMIKKEDFINLYGLDIIIDKNDKCWLLEINGNPNWYHVKDNDSINEMKREILDELGIIILNKYKNENNKLYNWKKIE